MDLINAQSNDDDTKINDTTMCTSKVIATRQSIIDSIENDSKNNVSVVEPNKKRKKKKKKSSYKDIMNNITKNTKTVDEEKNNHKKQLESLMKSANFEKINRI